MAAQRVDEQTQRGQRGLHLVRDAVQEILLALVEAYLAREPDADEEEAGNQEREEEPAQDQQDPVHAGQASRHRSKIRHDQDLPTHGKRDCNADEDDPDGERKPDRASLQELPPTA
jgi:hypothetical protein